MKTKFMVMVARMVSLAATVTLLAGCDDDLRRVSWSADGRHALIVAGDGLRLCDKHGTISNVIAPGVATASWMHNSNEVVVLEKAQARSWDEVRKVETAADIQKIIASASKVITQARAHKGDWKEFERAIDKTPYLSQAAVYVKEKNHDEMVNAFDKKWEEIERSVAVDISNLSIYKFPGNTLDPKQNPQLDTRKLLVRTTRPVREIRPAPNNKAVLYLVRNEPFEEGSPYELKVVSTISGESRTISTGSTLYPDWSEDGLSLVFIERGGGAGDLEPDDKFKTWGVATLVSAKVLNSDGTFAPKEPRKILARVPWQNFCRVRVTGDGTIVFCAGDVHLPCTDVEIPEKQSLFTIRPQAASVVSRLVPSTVDAELGDLVHLFELDSDNRFISIPDKKGTPSVCELATGKVVKLDAENFLPTNKLQFIPSWCGSSLCVPVDMKQESGGHAMEVSLWAPETGKAISLSQDWPKPARAGLLD